MASVETINLPHLPSLPVHIALYRDIQNPVFLKAQLLAGQKEFEYAFVDASMVCSVYFVLQHEIENPRGNKQKRPSLTSSNRFCQGPMSLLQCLEPSMITRTTD